MNTGKAIGKKQAQTPYDRIETFDAGLTDPGNDFFLLKSLSGPKIFEQCVTPTLSAPPYDRLVESIIPITRDAKGGHHFTNGDTWVECLALSLKMPGDSRPALKPGRHVASNYAVGGARTAQLIRAGFICRIKRTLLSKTGLKRPPKPYLSWKSEEMTYVMQSRED